MSVVSTLVEPAYRACPEWHQTFGDEVADLAELAGFAPDPEQRLGLDMLFAVDRFGKSVAFEFAVICARQNLKTGLFKQAALGWLFITDEKLIIWSAHEFDTASQAHRDMVDLIDGSDWLRGRVKQVYNSSMDKSIELTSGARLRFKARTKTGGRGLTAPKVVLDEAFALRPAHVGALLPAMSAMPDPQVVYGSSAGTVNSAVLRGIRDRGRVGRGRIAYLEWLGQNMVCDQEECSHEVGTVGCALDRLENWQQSNPLLGRHRANGTGLTVEHVQAERDAMPPDEFARERCGRWDDPGAEALFGPGNWDGCGPRPDQLNETTGLDVGALGVATSVDLKYSAIVAAACDGDRFVIKPLAYAPGTDWVVDEAERLSVELSVPVIIDGGGPAKHLVPMLKASSAWVNVCAMDEVLDGCAQFDQLVKAKRIGHAAYPELEAAVNGAIRRNVGDRWAWGRRQSTSEISPLEAATLAVWWVNQPDDGGILF